MHIAALILIATGIACIIAGIGLLWGTGPCLIAGGVALIAGGWFVLRGIE